MKYLLKLSLFMIISTLLLTLSYSQVVVSPSFHAVQYHHEFKCGESVTFTYNGSEVTYGTVESNGRCWLDRNLGASQVATSSTDYLAYGDLFQWGRGADGHQLINWTNSTTGTPVNGTTFTLSNTDDPGHNNFIANPNSPYDWRNPQNANLWQGVNGVNNPCPCGWRAPTIDEWDSERLSWVTNNEAGAYSSPLKLVMAGFRWNNDGSVVYAGQYGRYFSSNVDGIFAKYLNFDGISAAIGSMRRGYAMPFRCIKELPLESYLKAYYPFNANSNDESGNDNHLTVINADLCNDRSGNPQSAYYFNGTDAYLQFDQSLAVTNEFSITAWINPHQIISFQHTIISERFPSQNYQFAIVGGNLYFSIWTSCGQLPFTGSSINENEWQFVAVTYKNFNVKLYKNGVVDQSFYPNSSCMYTSQNSQMHVGVDKPFSDYFKGCIDEIRFYSKALDEDEILLIYEE